VVEQEFMRWADSVSLAEKLRTMRMARFRVGEGFLRCWSPIRGSIRKVKLDLALIEADQVTTPQLLRQSATIYAIDGIIFDQHGNPVEYHVLKSHPGTASSGSRSITTEFQLHRSFTTSAPIGRGKAGHSRDHPALHYLPSCGGTH